MDMEALVSQIWKLINMQNNYWSNVSSSDISNSIYDYNDDFERNGNVDFSNALSSPLINLSSVKNLKVTRLASSTELTWDANVETDLKMGIKFIMVH